MPAKSKQQQKFFGVVKAMQAGDIPKKGEAGKVAKDMSKKEVDKYAGTKHKGLPKKVKKETMKISDIKKMVKEELANVLESLNDPILKKLRTLPKGNLLPPLDKWWEAQPEDLLSAVYWSKGQLPPREPAKFEKAYNDIVKQLHVKYPIPAEILPKLDLDDETEKAIMMDAPSMNEAKMTPAKVQKAQRELVATIQLLKKNFPMYKAAKESGDEKKLAKHRDIAVKLTKKKKQLELALDKALGGLYQDAELELKEAAPRMKKDAYVEKLRLLYKDIAQMDRQMKTADSSRYSHVRRDWDKALLHIAKLTNVLNRKGPTIPEGKLTETVYDDMLRAVPDNYSYKDLADVVANIIKNEYGSHNIKPFMRELGRSLKEGKLNEALPKFKTPVEAYKWIMNKRGEAMDIEDQMRETSAEIQSAYGEMEQEAEASGGPVADRYGKEIEALENKHKELRSEFDMVMAEIDEYDQNY
jgi:hypothetical protein